MSGPEFTARRKSSAKHSSECRKRKQRVSIRSSSKPKPKLVSRTPFKEISEERILAVRQQLDGQLRPELQARNVDAVASCRDCKVLGNVSARSPIRCLPDWDLNFEPELNSSGYTHLHDEQQQQQTEQPMPSAYDHLESAGKPQQDVGAVLASCQDFEVRGNVSAPPISCLPGWDLNFERDFEPELNSSGTHLHDEQQQQQTEQPMLSSTYDHLESPGKPQQDVGAVLASCHDFKVLGNVSAPPPITRKFKALPSWSHACAWLQEYWNHRLRMARGILEPPGPLNTLRQSGCGSGGNEPMDVNKSSSFHEPVQASVGGEKSPAAGNLGHVHDVNLFDTCVHGHQKESSGRFFARVTCRIICK